MMVLLATGTTQAETQETRTTINIASTFPRDIPIAGTVNTGLSKKIDRLSGGTFSVAFHEPNELAPAKEVISAVSEGKIDGAWSGAGWFSSKDSAFNFFSSVPFGPSISEYLAWLYEGGGLELSRQMFHKYNVHNVPCGMISPEAAGWFPKEIRNVEDLSGLRMRIFGLGAMVMQKLGVETVQLTSTDLMTAFESGEVDAAEYSAPAIDQPLGFSKYAKFYYFPGWQQQATLFMLFINKTRWDALPDQHKAMIEITCGDVMRGMIAKSEAVQWRAMNQLRMDGVIFKRWEPELLVAFEDAWLEVAAEQSANTPNFKRVYDSYIEFRKNYAMWRRFSFLQ